MKIFLKIYLIIGLVILLTYSLQAGDKKQPKYIYKIASEAPDGSSWVTSIKQISRELYKKTNGEIGIKVYPGSIMGDQSTVVKKIKIGQLSGATFSSGGLSLIYKDFAVMGFPMIFRNYGEYDYVKEKMTDYFEQKFAENGYVLLTWSEVGLIYLYSKKKVNSVEALKKAKPLLLEGDTISQALFNQVNATPVSLKISDVMTGLQTGLIDTIFSSPYGLIAMQWFTKVKYKADFPITFMIAAVMVDKELFDSMPVEYQKEMKNQFRSAFVKLNDKVRRDDEAASISLKKQGIVTLPVSDNDISIFRRVSTNVADHFTEKEYSRELYKKINGYLDEYRKNN